MEQIKESDWKIFRQLHPILVERFCGQIVKESEQTHSDANYGD